MSGGEITPADPAAPVRERDNSEKKVSRIRQLFDKAKGKLSGAFSSSPEADATAAPKPANAAESRVDTPPPINPSASVTQSSPARNTESVAALIPGHQASPITQEGAAAEVFISQQSPAIQEGGTIVDAAISRSAPGEVEATEIGYTDARTAGPPVRFLLAAKNAPKWNKALGIMANSLEVMERNSAMESIKETDKKRYEALQGAEKSLQEQGNKNTDEFFSLNSARPEEKAVVQRLKQYLPRLAAIRGAAMAAAAWDPHKVAPVICACVFFAIDVGFNSLSPEDKARMRNIIFECTIAINEWISFESNCPKKTHESIKTEVKELEDKLVDQYLLALRLLCDVILSCNAGKGKQAKDKLTNKIIEYGERLNILKDHKMMWAHQKKTMEEKLANDKDVGEVLKWIKSKEDFEETLETIETRVTAARRYLDCADWALRTKEFQAWFGPGGPQDLKNNHGHETTREREKDIKRVLWVRGSLGTGKTAIMYRMTSELRALAENHMHHDQDSALFEDGLASREIRVISHFCSTSANYTIVLRALAQKLALLPDFTLAQQASKFHSSYNKNGTEKQPEDDKTEEFIHSSLKDQRGTTDFVFLIDALDELDDPTIDPVSEKLLKLLSRLLTDSPNLRVVCSSKAHVPVTSFINKDFVMLIDVLAIAPSREIELFITKEIDVRREADHEQKANSGNDEGGSIFFQTGQETLCKDLADALIERSGGMFEWVNVWLKITIPMDNTKKITRSERKARSYIEDIKTSSVSSHGAYDKIKEAYDRLWKLGALDGLDKTRIRLFRLVLASFSPIPLEQLASLLQISMSEEDLETRLSASDIKTLCSNFFNLDPKAWRFTHDSARTYVVREILGPDTPPAEETIVESSKDLSQSLYLRVGKENHRIFSALFVEVMQRLEHPYWGDQLARQTYLLEYGFHHCRSAAAKQSLSDDIWSQVVHKVLLPQAQAGLHSTPLHHVRCNLDFRRDRRSGISDDFSTPCTDGKDSPSVLFAHVLMWLGIIHPDDIMMIHQQDEPAAEPDRMAVLRRFADSAPNGNRRGYTAVEMAAYYGDAPALSFALECICLHSSTGYGRRVCMDLLLKPSAGSWRSRETIFAQEVASCVYNGRVVGPSSLSVAILEALLLFEAKYLGNLDISKEAEPRKVLQWSFPLYADQDEGFSYDQLEPVTEEFLPNDNVLTLAIKKMDQDTLCHLLKVAVPAAANEPNPLGDYPLYVARWSERHKVVQVLIDDCQVERE